MGGAPVRSSRLEIRVRIRVTWASCACRFACRAVSGPGAGRACRWRRAPRAAISSRAVLPRAECARCRLDEDEAVGFAISAATGSTPPLPPPRGVPRGVPRGRRDGGGLGACCGGRVTAVALRPTITSSTDLDVT